MLFLLRKIGEALLLPIGISLILTLAGIALRRRLVAFAGFLTLYLFSTPAIAVLIMESLERVYEPKTVAAAPNADAVVVLGGGVVRGVTAPGIQWGDSANRYFAGFDLAMAGKAGLVVFSTAATEQPGISQGAIMRRSAIEHGIAPERIVLTPRVLTTADEARAVAAIPNIHSILLVTSAFHMPRAVMLFRARGLNVIPFPTDERTLGGRTFNPAAWLPSSSYLQRSEQGLREYYGLAIYRIILLF